MNLTESEQRDLDGLMNDRETARRALDRTRGLSGNGAEAAYSQACAALALFHRTHGNAGYMTPKRKWTKR